MFETPIDLRKSELLHLATHGFFFDAPDTDGTPAGPSLPGMRTTPHGGNPMHRSGLALSGAAAALAGRPRLDQEDGIVTAEEIGGLDLWGTRLAVLSACDTARGETQSGEGVLGLRRAFVQAGAQNLLLTLWRVEDSFTRDLMIQFYREFLESNDAIAALSKVQRTLLANHAPTFWAPFLISVQGSGIE